MSFLFSIQQGESTAGNILLMIVTLS